MAEVLDRPVYEATIQDDDTVQVTRDGVVNEYASMNDAVAAIGRDASPVFQPVGQQRRVLAERFGRAQGDDAARLLAQLRVQAAADTRGTVADSRGGGVHGVDRILYSFN